MVMMFRKQRSGATGGGLGVLGALLVAGAANAEGMASESELVNVSDIQGVESWTRLDDGSIQLVMKDGTTIIVPEGMAVVENGTLLLDPAFASGLPVETGGFLLTPQGGLLVAGGVGAAAAVSSGGGSDAPNSAPSFTSAAEASVAENTATAYTAAATDANGDAITYSLSGEDAALFEIDSSTGVVTFKSGPDFEAPSDANGDNTYNVVVTASDGKASTDQAVAITVNNTNDNAPEFTSAAAVTVRENSSAVLLAAATDADGNAITYSLSGEDADLFQIDASTGEVRFVSAPDYEAPADANGDNVYNIVVTASDGLNTTDQAVTVTVSNMLEVPPAITSAVVANVWEGATSVITVTATDLDEDPITYSLTGTDAALFSIDPATGEIRFLEAPDYEAPTDANGDNVYEVTVAASDGMFVTEQGLTITVNDINPAPTFETEAAQSVSVDEGQLIVEAGVFAMDAEGEAITYSLTGVDAVFFEYDEATGTLSFVDAPDYELPADENGQNTYEVSLVASDGVNETYRNYIVTVEDVAEAPPTFTSQTAFTINENTTAVTTLEATDADGNPISFFFASDAGPDAGAFELDTVTGVLSFRIPPDFELPQDANADNVYEVNIRASSTDGYEEKTFYITVADVDETLPGTLTIQGYASSGIGYSVSDAGDVDGDGYDDFLIGSYIGHTDLGNWYGQSWLVWGSSATAESDGVLDLSTAVADGTAVRIDGANVWDVSGQSVSSAGDVDGDGLDDVLIGGNTGTYLVWGSALSTDADGVIDLENLVSNGEGLYFSGVTSGAGLVVANAGDVDGDGVNDILIGNAYAESASNGAVYLVWGASAIADADGMIALDTLAADGAGVVISGADNEQLGGAVSSAGDVDGDGYDDVLIGARGADVNGDVDAGAAYVFSGAALAADTDGNVSAATAVADGDAIILRGINADDQAGYSISNLGDLDGDGYGDILIGAPYNDDGALSAGSAYIVWGSAIESDADGVIDLGTIAADGTGVVLMSSEASDLAGWSVSNAGDIDGDGIDDILVGAWGMSSQYANVGENAAYVVWGAAIVDDVDGVIDFASLESDGNGIPLLPQTDTYARTGYSVSAAGDVDGDGYADILVSAYRADVGADGYQDGEVYLISGADLIPDPVTPLQETIEPAIEVPVPPVEPDGWA